MMQGNRRNKKQLFAERVLWALVGLAMTLISEGVSSGLANETGYKLTYRDALFGVSFIDGQTGLAVGKTGLVLKTSDGGKEWEKVELGLRNSLNKVTFNGGEGWIVGNDGLVLHSSDGGKQWVRKELGSKFSRLGLTDIAFVNKQRGFIVGEMGEILKTTDGGQSWESVPIDWLAVFPEDLTSKGIYALNLYDIFFLNDKEGWMVGDWGTVVHTADGGEQWTVLRIGYFPHLFSVCFRDKEVGYAVGQNGTFLVTKDGGTSWHSQPDLVLEDNLFKVVLQGQSAVAVGEQGLVFESSDGGEHWTKVGLKKEALPGLSSGTWLADVCCIPGSNTPRCIVVGRAVTLELLMTGQGCSLGGLEHD